MTQAPESPLETRLDGFDPDEQADLRAFSAVYGLHSLRVTL